MKNTYREFVKFLKEYKIMGLAIGIIIGTAVTKLVNAVVNDIVMPIIEAFIPGDNWRELLWTFRGIEFKIGNLLGNTIDFLIIALLVFLFVKMVMKQEEVKKV